MSQATYGSKMLIKLFLACMFIPSIIIDANESKNFVENPSSTRVGRFFGLLSGNKKQKCHSDSNRDFMMCNFPFGNFRMQQKKLRESFMYTQFGLSKIIPYLLLTVKNSQTFGTKFSFSLNSLPLPSSTQAHLPSIFLKK